MNTMRKARLILNMTIWKATGWIRGTVKRNCLVINGGRISKHLKRPGTLGACYVQELTRSGMCQEYEENGRR